MRQITILSHARHLHNSVLLVTTLELKMLGILLKHCKKIQ